MRNTPKLRLYQHIIDNADEMMRIMEGNPFFDVDMLPNYSEMYHFYMEIIELSMIRGLKNPNGIVLLDWLAIKSNYTFYFRRIDFKQIQNHPKIARQVSEEVKESDYCYFLESRNPNQTRALIDIITDIIDRTNDGRTYIYKDTFRRTLFCFPETEGTMWYERRWTNGTGKNRANVWLRRARELDEIISREYKAY